jgi:hypothetical protein
MMCVRENDFPRNVQAMLSVRRSRKSGKAFRRTPVLDNPAIFHPFAS